MRKCYTKRYVSKVVDEYIPLRMRFFAKDSLNVIHNVTNFIKSFVKTPCKFNITLYSGLEISFSYSDIIFTDNDADVHLIVENYNKNYFELL